MMTILSGPALELKGGKLEMTALGAPLWTEMTPLVTGETALVTRPVRRRMRCPKEDEIPWWTCEGMWAGSA